MSPLRTAALRDGSGSDYPHLLIVRAIPQPPARTAQGSQADRSRAARPSQPLTRSSSATALQQIPPRSPYSRNKLRRVSVFMDERARPHAASAPPDKPISSPLQALLRTLLRPRIDGRELLFGDRHRPGSRPPGGTQRVLCSCVQASDAFGLEPGLYPLLLRLLLNDGNGHHRRAQVGRAVP